MPLIKKSSVRRKICKLPKFKLDKQRRYLLDANGNEIDISNVEVGYCTKDKKI